MKLSSPGDCFWNNSCRRGAGELVQVCDITHLGCDIGEGINKKNIGLKVVQCA